MQSLISQLSSHARLPVTNVSPVMDTLPTSSFPMATITAQGFLDPQSSSGTVSFLFPSSSLRFHHNILTFQHQCLSSLSNILSSDSWIIDSGATTHVCSQLTMFSETFPVQGVTVSFPDGIRVAITHT